VFGKSLEEKREYIAKIAGDVFFSKGYKDSSLQDISERGNISKAGIYHYFRTKEDILVYLLLKNTEQGVQALKDSLKDSQEKGFNARKSFEALIKTYAAYLLKNKKTSRLVLRERHQLSGKNRKVLQDQERAIFLFIRDELKKLPGLNPELNLSLISFQIISMNHWMGYWFKDRDDLSQTAALDQSVHLIFDGILKTPLDSGQ
jgi:TetR/AcrR family transcriptional regulator, cholesterol catabolism regulator